MFGARQGLGVNNKPHIVIRTTSFPCVTIRKSICIRLLNLVTKLAHMCSPLAFTAVTIMQKMLRITSFLPATLCAMENKTGLSGWSSIVEQINELMGWGLAKCHAANVGLIA